MLERVSFIAMHRPLAHRSLPSQGRPFDGCVPLMMSSWCPHGLVADAPAAVCWPATSWKPASLHFNCPKALWNQSFKFQFITQWLNIIHIFIYLIKKNSLKNVELFLWNTKAPKLGNEY